MVGRALSHSASPSIQNLCNYSHIQALGHSCMQVLTQPFLNVRSHSTTQAPSQLLDHSAIPLFKPSLGHSATQSLSHVFSQGFTWPFLHSRSHPVTLSGIHSITQPFLHSSPHVAIGSFRPSTTFRAGLHSAVPSLRASLGHSVTQSLSCSCVQALIQPSRLFSRSVP